MLVNISGDSDILAFILRITYLMITSMQIPLVFFVGKEALISIYEEAMYRAISFKVEKLYLEGNANESEEGESVDFQRSTNKKVSNIMAHGSKL